MKRYFIMFYVYRNKLGMGYGNASVCINNGCYPNRDSIAKELKGDGKDIVGGEIENINITNIIELNETDFDNWRKQL